ncbi:hypothetical protein P8452_43101 [Trifolium repens]|nr:hypothetical protein P8452_43101 [Trifolium repens]
MAEAPAQLNEQNDDPRIGKEVVVAHVDEPIGGESDVSCLEELNAIQERFKLADHDMKLQIKEELRLIAYPEITSVNAPAKKCDTKGAKKRMRSTISESSSGRSLSHWEHIDHRIPDSQGSQSKPSRPKKKTARIEDIIDVAPDGHCGFRVVAQHLALIPKQKSNEDDPIDVSD